MLLEIYLLLKTSYSLLLLNQRKLTTPWWVTSTK